MYGRKTVFILGVGASKPYGYPTGEELKEFIANDFPLAYRAYINSKEKISKHKMPLTDNEVNLMVKEAESFSRDFEGAGDFIDRYLNRFKNKKKEYVKLGQKAILLKMFNEERTGGYGSFLKKLQIFDESSGGMGKYNYEQDWFEYFFRETASDYVNYNDYKKLLKEMECCFITFNYDRSFEEFFHYFMIQNYSIKTTERNQKIEKELIRFSKNNIFHVYGQIAPLRWQDPDNFIDFESFVDNKTFTSKCDLDKLIGNIELIYTKRRNKNLNKIYKKISEAKIIFFLGFGFDRENLKILKIPELLDYKVQRIIATAYNYSEQQIKNLRYLFRNKTHSLTETNFIVKDMNCRELLENYLYYE